MDEAMEFSSGMAELTTTVDEAKAEAHDGKAFIIYIS